MSRREISEEKMRRIAVGATVAGVLLILFLIVFLIIQFVTIGTGTSRRAQLDEEIARYTEAIKEGEDNLEWYQSASGLYFTARQYGWR